MMHEAGVDRAVIVPPHPQLAMTADHLGVTEDIVKEGKLTEGATYRQRVTHFTETLDFLSNEDKEWIMGRVILARLNWS